MLTIILVILSIVFLGYSIFLCSKMIRSLSKRIQRRAAHIILSLIIIFFVGDVIYLAFNFSALFGNFLVSLIFFLTAFFAMLVLEVSLSIVHSLVCKNQELKNLNSELLKETGSLDSSKKRLQRIRKIVEEKNKELESTLEDFYTLRLDMASSSGKQIEKENLWLKRKLNALKKK